MLSPQKVFNRIYALIFNYMLYFVRLTYYDFCKRGYRTYFHETRMEDRSQPRIDPINFWCGVFLREHCIDDGGKKKEKKKKHI